AASTDSAAGRSRPPSTSTAWGVGSPVRAGTPAAGGAEAQATERATPGSGSKRVTINSGYSVDDGDRSDGGRGYPAAGGGCCVWVTGSGTGEACLAVGGRFA